MSKSNSTSKFFRGRLYARMSEDLHLGGMSERTHAGYLRAVRQLADYCRTAPDKISEDQLRGYLLFLKNEKKFAYGSLRVAYFGIKFFYTRTCKREWQTLAQMKLQNVKSLPEDEVNASKSRSGWKRTNPRSWSFGGQTHSLDSSRVHLVLSRYAGSKTISLEFDTSH